MGMRSTCVCAQAGHVTIDSRISAAMGVHRFALGRRRLYTRREAAGASPRVTAFPVASSAAAFRYSASVVVFARTVVGQPVSHRGADNEGLLASRTPRSLLNVVTVSVDPLLPVVNGDFGEVQFSLFASTPPRALV